jgi:hypothetical protein
MAAAKKLDLANLGGGELVATVDRELKKLCENIADCNVKTEAVRKVTINIAVKPDKKGQTAAVSYSVKSSLPGPDASVVQAYIAMAPGTTDIALFGVDTRQEELFGKEPLVSEIKPQSEQPKMAEPAKPAAFAPPITSN